MVVFHSLMAIINCGRRCRLWKVWRDSVFANNFTICKWRFQNTCENSKYESVSPYPSRSHSQPRSSSGTSHWAAWASPRSAPPSQQVLWLRARPKTNVSTRKLMRKLSFFPILPYPFASSRQRLHSWQMGGRSPQEIHHHGSRTTCNVRGVLNFNTSKNQRGVDNLRKDVLALSVVILRLLLR